MKILLYSNVLFMGGVEQHLLNLRDALLRAGHSALLAGRAVALGDNGFPQLAAWHGNSDHVVCEYPAEIIKGFSPDMVNIQLPFPSELTEAIEAPVVYTVHGKSSVDEPMARPAPVIVMDARWERAARLLAGSYGSFHIRNGIDLRRFRFFDDAIQREGLAYYGRFADAKMGAARGLHGRVKIDLWGGFNWPEDEWAIPRGPCRAEDVGNRYRIVTATGLAALEIMACGALLLAPELTDARLERLADSSFAVTEYYPERNEHLAWEDYQRLRALSIEGTRMLAARQWRWVVENHDADGMAARFLRVYKEAAT